MPLCTPRGKYDIRAKLAYLHTYMRRIKPDAYVVSMRQLAPEAVCIPGHIVSISSGWAGGGELPTAPRGKILLQNGEKQFFPMLHTVQAAH